MRRLVVSVVLLGACVAGLAQEVSRPEYSVYTAKPIQSSAPLSFSGCKEDEARVHCDATLRALVGFAYGYRGVFVLDATGWMDNEVFDLDAVIDPKDVTRARMLSQADRSAMLQSVLADLFKLKIHRAMQTEPVYEVVVAPGGAKLRPASDAPDADLANMPAGFPKTGFITMSHGEAKGFGVSMEEILRQLPGIYNQAQRGLEDPFGRPLIDKTGLTGRYNFTVSRDTEQQAAASPAEGAADTEPSAFTEIQEQLGLKMVPAKDSVPVLVIDSATQSSTR